MMGAVCIPFYIMNKNFIPSFPKIGRKSKSVPRVVFKVEKIKTGQALEMQVIRTLEKLLTPQKTTVTKSSLQSTMRLRKFLKNTGFLYEGRSKY